MARCEICTKGFHNLGHYCEDDPSDDTGNSSLVYNAKDGSCFERRNISVSQCALRLICQALRPNGSLPFSTQQ